jgi:hypothetical protein
MCICINVTRCFLSQGIKWPKRGNIYCREGRLGTGIVGQPMGTNAYGALFSRGWVREETKIHDTAMQNTVIVAFNSILPCVFAHAPFHE